MGKLFFIAGNDRFAVRARAREVVTELCGEEFENNPELEVIRGDFGELSPSAAVGAAVAAIAEFLAALRTPPFLSAGKTVWLKNFECFPELMDSSAPEAVAAVNSLQEYLKTPIPDDLNVVVDGGEIDQRKSLFKAFKQAEGAVVTILRKAELSDKDYTRNQSAKVEELLSGNNLRVEPEAVDFLVNAVGSDSGRLLGEIAKIVDYMDGENRPVTLADCQRVVSRTPEALSWEFANALTSGNVKAALTVADTSIEAMRGAKSGGNLELGLIYQAMRAFKDVMDTRIAMEELQVPPRAGKNYFYSLSEEEKSAHKDNILVKSHPFRAYKLVETAANFPPKKVASALRALLAANRKLVSGGGDSRMVLEEMIIAICRD